MSWLFPSAFEYRDRRYYFCSGGGLAYPLNPGEADKIALQLGIVFVLTVLGFIGWAGFSLYLSAQTLGALEAIGPRWLLDSSTVYPVAFSYWIVTWLLSTAVWFGISSRLAQRDVTLNICTGRPDQVLKSIRPLPTLALGVIMCAFVGQGFGDICFLFRGTGHCEIISITPL
jgi:hypothetical protein